MKNIITAISRRTIAAIVAVIALVMCAPLAFAAPKTVTGTVLDGEGLEVIGGLVEVKGTKTKVVTDLNGVYTIEVANPPQGCACFFVSRMRDQGRTGEWPY